MRIPKLTRTLLVGALLAAAAPSPADARRIDGERVAGGQGSRRTTAQLNGESLGRVPRRVSPPERPAGRRPGAAAPESPRTADGATRNLSGSASAVSLGLGFDGPAYNDSLSYPPDTHGDVGPEQVVVMINGRVRSYAKSTGLADGALNADTDVFWASVMTPVTGSVTSNFATDPRIRYDRLSQRWIALMIDVPNGGSRQNRIMLAVSDGPVITASTVWTFFSFAAGTASEFTDYPTMGVDANAVYIGTNQFTLTGSFAGSDAYVVRKSSLLAGGALTVTKFDVLPTVSSAGPFTPQGVDNASPGASTGWLVGVDNVEFGKLDLVKITDPGSATPTAATSALTVPSTAFPVDVSHEGGSPKLDAVDDRLFAASMRDGHVWTAHNIGVTGAGVASGSATRTGSRWYDIDVSSGTPALSQSGTVYDSAASSPRSYWIPSVAVNGQGSMVVGGSTAGATAKVDAWFSGRRSGTAAGVVDLPTRFTTTGSTYNPPYDRWGDYSVGRVDPEDDQTVWTFQEYVRATNTWGVRVARIAAPAPAAPAVTGDGVVERGRSGVELVLTGGSDGPWFEPGASFAEHLTVTAGCGIAVTDVDVTSATTLTATLDTTGATAGSCDVTVTNPDGQSATATGLLRSTAAPSATDDAYATEPGTVLSGTTVLANDSDADGDALSAELVTAPAHGTLLLAANGTFSYEPDAGYAGADAFAYRASDTLLRSAPATVRITVGSGDEAAAESPTPTTDSPPPASTTPTTPAETIPAEPAPAESLPAGDPVPVANLCVVPRLKRHTLAYAKRALTRAHCRLGTVRRVRTHRVPHRRVVRQSLVPGARRPAGTRVSLAIRR